MKKYHQLILRVLIIQQGDLWAAQCIDHDIVAQGKSIKDAKQAFERTVIGQILHDLENHREPLAAFPPAPQKLQELFDKVADVTLADKGPILPEGMPSAFICNQITKEFRVWS
jgi:hypothetical protein